MGGAVIETGQNTTASERSLSEIRNLPVVFIENGREFGRVESFIIDYAKGVVLGYVLTAGEHTGARVVSPSSVSRYGSFAVTVTGKNAVEDVGSNEEFSRIYNSDPDMIGLPVYEKETGGEPVGFVKDASFNIQNCKMTTVTVSNDKGFSSPYYARINFRDIAKVMKGRVVLQETCKINFRRQGALERASESGGLVPLVVREHEWRQALNERVAEEAEKLKRRLLDSFGAEHEKFFLANEQNKLKSELLENIQQSVAALFDSRMADISKSFAAEISEKISSMAGRESVAAVVEKMAAGFAEAAARSERNAEEIQRVAAGIDARLKERMAAFETAIAEKSLAAVEAARTRMMELAVRKIEDIRAEAHFKAVEVEDRIETKLLAISAAVQQFERGVGSTAADLRNAIKLAEEAARGEANEKIERLAIAVEALNKKIEEIRNAPAPAAPDLSPYATREDFARMRESLDAALSSAAEKTEKHIDEIFRVATGSTTAASAEIETIRTGVLEALESRFAALSENLESKFAETRDELDGVSTRLFDNIESRISSLATLDALEDRIAGIAVPQPPDSAPLEELRRRVDEIVAKGSEAEPPASVINKIADLDRHLDMVENVERLNREAQAATVRHLAELRNELSGKVDSALEKIAGFANELQSGKIYSSIHQTAIDELKKRVEEIAGNTAEPASDILTRIKDIETRLEGTLQKEAIESVSDLIAGFATAPPAMPVAAGSGVSEERLGEAINEALKASGALDVRRELMDKVDAAVETFSKAMLTMQASGGPGGADTSGLQKQIDRLSAKVSGVDVSSTIVSRIQQMEQQFEHFVSREDLERMSPGEKIAADIAAMAERAMERSDERIKEIGAKLNSTLEKYCSRDDAAAMIAAAVAEAENRLRESLKNTGGEIS